MNMVACSFLPLLLVPFVVWTINAAHFSIALRAHREISMSVHNWNQKMKEVICFTVLFFSFGFKKKSSSLVDSYNYLFFPFFLSLSLSLFSIHQFICMWFMDAERTNVFLICWMKIPLTFSVRWNGDESKNGDRKSFSAATMTTTMSPAYSFIFSE